eukprot:UN04351
MQGKAKKEREYNENDWMYIYEIIYNMSFVFEMREGLSLYMIIFCLFVCLHIMCVCIMRISILS